MNRLMRRLTRKLRRRFRLSEAEAQDLIQEAWRRTLEYCQDHEAQNTVALIETTAKHLAIDQYRHAKKFPHDKDDVLWLEQRLPLVSPARNPEEDLAARERLNKIRDALNELLEGTGDIFVLHRAGHSYKELATEFKLAESTIEKRIARAMLYLMDQKE